MTIACRNSLTIVAALCVALAASAWTGTARAQSTAGIADNEGIFIDGKTFQIPSLQQRGKGFGIIRLDESLAELVRAGRVTRDEAVSYAENPGDLEEALEGRRAAAPAIEPPKKADPNTLLGKAGQLFARRGG